MAAFDVNAHMSAFDVNTPMQPDELIRQLELSFGDVDKDSTKRTRPIIVNPEQVRIIYNYFVTGGKVAAALTAAVAAAKLSNISIKDIIIVILYFVASIVDTGVILVSAAATQVASAAGTCVSIVGNVAERAIEAVSTLLGYFTVENFDTAAGIAVGAAEGAVANAVYSKIQQYVDNRYVMFQDIADTINALYQINSDAAVLLQSFKDNNLLLYTPSEDLNSQPSAFLDVGTCVAAGSSLSNNLEMFEQAILDRNAAKLAETAQIIARSVSYNQDQPLVLSAAVLAPGDNAVDYQGTAVAGQKLTEQQKQLYCADQSIRNAIAERRRIIVSNAFIQLELSGLSTTNLRLNLQGLQDAVNDAIRDDPILPRYLEINTNTCSEVTQSQGDETRDKKRQTIFSSLTYGGRRTKGRKAYRKSYKKRTHKRRPRRKTHKLLKRKRRRTRK